MLYRKNLKMPESRICDRMPAPLLVHKPEALLGEDLTDFRDPNAIYFLRHFDAGGRGEEKLVVLPPGKRQPERIEPEKPGLFLKPRGERDALLPEFGTNPAGSPFQEMPEIAGKPV